MSDFTATRAHVYTTAAVIYAAYHNTNENEIYNKYNGAFHETTGHGHTGGTGDGPKLTSTGLDLTAAYAWTGAHSFTNVTSLTMSTTSKLYFRDTNAYLYSASATNMEWYVDANLFLTLGNSAGNRFVQSSQTLLVSSGTKLGFDGAAATTNYLQLTGGSLVAYVDNNLYLTMGNSAGTRFIQSSQNFLLNSNKLAYDGVANSTYYTQYTGGNLVTVFDNNTYLTIGNAAGTRFIQASYQFMTASGVRIGLDGGAPGDTFLVESSANVMDQVVGDTTVLQLTTSNLNVFGTTYKWSSAGDVTCRKLFVNGGTTYYFDNNGDINARAGIFAMGLSSGSDTATIDVSGANAGAGAAYGVYFSTLGGTLDASMRFAAVYTDTTALGAFYGRIPIRIDGVGTRYIALYS